MSIKAALTLEAKKEIASGDLKRKSITWEIFKKRYLTREDGFTYEWVNGRVEKTKRTMDYKQFFIVENLMIFFMDLRNSIGLQGLLSNEIDTFFSGNHRRPDMFYLTSEQIRGAKNGIPPVPQFVIEIISNNDKFKNVHEKMKNYWDAGVQVVWHILPDLEQVHIYKGKNMVVLSGNDLCSAEPVMSEFVIPVKDIFK